jgi:hypothetical protein
MTSLPVIISPELYHFRTLGLSLAALFSLFVKRARENFFKVIQYSFLCVTNLTGTANAVSNISLVNASPGVFGFS